VQNRVKDSASAYTISTPARLTISGVLPSASLSRIVGASNRDVGGVMNGLDTSARRVPTTPAGSTTPLHKRHQSAEIGIRVGIKSYK
jgi:hypothetical protein